jgi:hypothetical protein
MSVTKKGSEMDEVHTTFGLSAAGQKCWACGGLLSDPAVMWHFGHVGQQLYLCPECAKSVSMGMIRDAVDITHARGLR